MNFGSNAWDWHERRLFDWERKADMENILIVLAAGKSSRFGGYPKAFCRLNGQTNVAHTVSLAHQYFSKVYVVVNEMRILF